MTRLEEAERRLEEFEGRNAPEEMKEGSALEEPRTRMIKISVPATHTTLDTVIPEAFHPEDLGDLPEQLRRELELPEAESVRYLRQAIRYTKRVAHSRLDETQTGGLFWYIWFNLKLSNPLIIHIPGFCARCGHYLLLPPEFTAAQKTAVVELHALDWCPRTCAAVINERQVMRRRFYLVGREKDAYHIFIPGEKVAIFEK
uniref:snRNA-activating protein complex subunit 3 n=1 Tax=Loa loa TaxID=7209 RepID=A0A1I7V6E7_LOALO